MAKYKIYIGKGGVGKSTCSSLCAVNLISSGKKISLISLDPAHNLHDIFSCKLTKRPKKMFDNLYVSEADLAKKQKEYIDDIRNTLKGVYHYQQSLNLEKYYSILKYSPGTEEYASLLILEEQFASKQYDNIVIDTPPTALTLKTLALPQVNLHWIDSLADMRKEIIDKKNTIAKIRKNHLARLDEDQVFIRLQHMKARYEKLNSLLADTNTTELILVMNEDELSLSESELIKNQLNDLNLKISQIIINKSTGNEVWKAKIANLFPNTPISSVPEQESSIIGEETLKKLCHYVEK